MSQSINAGRKFYQNLAECSAVFGSAFDRILRPLPQGLPRIRTFPISQEDLQSIAGIIADSYPRFRPQFSSDQLIDQFQRATQ